MRVISKLTILIFCFLLSELWSVYYIQSIKRGNDTVMDDCLLANPHWSTLSPAYITVSLIRDQTHVPTAIPIWSNGEITVAAMVIFSVTSIIRGDRPRAGLSVLEWHAFTLFQHLARMCTVRLQCIPNASWLLFWILDSYLIHPRHMKHLSVNMVFVSSWKHLYSWTE